MCANQLVGNVDLVALTVCLRFCYIEEFVTELIWLTVLVSTVPITLNKLRDLSSEICIGSFRFHHWLTIWFDLSESVCLSESAWVDLILDSDWLVISSLSSGRSENWYDCRHYGNCRRFRTNWIWQQKDGWITWIFSNVQQEWCSNPLSQIREGNCGDSQMAESGYGLSRLHLSLSLAIMRSLMLMTSPLGASLTLQIGGPLCLS